MPAGREITSPPAPGAIDVWIVEPPLIQDGALLVAYDRLMSDDERAKQRAFVFEANRREQLVARALVRTTLSRYSSLRPEQWRFSRNAYGRPAIAPPSTLHFNLSHHPTMVVCAVTAGAEIGVDVEPLQRGDEILEIADRMFAKRELDDLRALPAAAVHDRAVSLWTLKEAYIKARGMGLRLPLDQFSIQIQPQRRIGIVFAPEFGDDAGRWCFTQASPSPRLRLAIADGSGQNGGLPIINQPWPVL